ncbi:MAG: hypothetical protein MSG78_04520 [Clostridiales bacterium]|nr:hypothetical protein [Clostridiales bacterium]
MKIKIFIFCVVLAVIVGGVYYYHTNTSEKQFTNALLVITEKQVKMI